MAGDERERNLIMQEVEEPELVRPINMCRYIAILTILCMSTFYCGYCLAYMTALGSTNIKIVYG
jgi:hypothetical protein